MLKKFLPLLLMVAASAEAQNIHFFGSIRASESTIRSDDVRFDRVSNQATIAPLSTAGISADASLNEKFQVLTQLILKSDRNIGIDLVQLRYFAQDGLLLRLGKQRLPSNLHSENIQVQALLPWLNAPREIYSRVPIYSFTGLSAEKKLGTHFGVHGYFGDTYDDFEGETGDYVFKTQNLIGARLNFTASVLEAFINHYRSSGILEVDAPTSLTSAGFPEGTQGTFSQKFKLSQISGTTAGVQLKPKDFFLLSEYSLIRSKSPVVETQESASVSVGKDVTETWTTVATFSTDLDVASRIGPSKTATYGLNLNYRFDLNNVIKIGFEHINYKEITVPSGLASPLPTTTNASTFVNASPGGNFDIYSLLWAFVY